MCCRHRERIEPVAVSICLHIGSLYRTTYNLDVKRQRLLAHDMQSLLDSGNGVICVDGSNSSNYYSIQILFLEHFIVVCIDFCSCEVFFCPYVLIEIRRAGCYHLGTRSKNVVVQCMSLACYVSIGGFRNPIGEQCLPIRPRPAIPTRNFGADILRRGDI